MVQLTRIYTRSGDTGKTSLGDGQRVLKSHPRIDLIGSVDESNAAIGVAACYVVEPEIKSLLQHIQNDLFDVGGDLCFPQKPEGGLEILEDQVTFLEQTMDRLNEGLNPLTSFVLPGGTPAAAHLHLARTVVRRTERLACAFEDPINPLIIKYLNRLSDLLFVLCRVTNHSKDILWTPGQGRKNDHNGSYQEGS